MSTQTIIESNERCMPATVERPWSGGSTLCNERNTRAVAARQR